MDQFKSWATSRAVWSGAFGMLVATAWGAKNLQSVDPEAFANAMVSFVTGLIFLATTIFRVVAKHQLVKSAEVAKEANKQMRPGVPSETALSVARATVAARDNNRSLR